MPRNSPPDYERCGFPAHNVNGHGEHTGAHLNERECFRAVYAAAVEASLKHVLEAITKAMAR